MKPLYWVWDLEYYWLRLLSERPDRVEHVEDNRWDSLANVDTVKQSLLPPTFVAFTAMVAAKRRAGIRHVETPVRIMTSALLGLTGKGWIAPTDPMSTLCSLWERKLFGTKEGNSPLGRYCPFCGSAIAQTRRQFISAFSWGTTSSNGRNYFLRNKHVYCSLTMESPSESHRLFPAPILTRTQWWWKPKRVPGKLTLWRDVDGNFVPTPTIGPILMDSAETEPVESIWR